MRIGFVSTRFAGTDGVSLESLKWAEVLDELGHEVFWFSGRSDRDPSRSICVPEAFFGHPENQWLAERLWGVTRCGPEVERRLREVAHELKTMLGHFVQQFGIDLLIPENVLAIPVHVPLGLAVAEFLAESGIPALAHHHDFAWERDRFTVSAVPEILAEVFPPRLPNVIHTVINRAAQADLARRRGIDSLLIPNVFDFAHEPAPGDLGGPDFRAEFGLGPDDLVILQPTRLVPRKGIEHAIELVSRLGDPRCKLVISHDAGDEGYEYQEELVRTAGEKGVGLLLIADRIADRRGRDRQGRRTFTLWDIYPHADFVTFPSLCEGFGNALLEAVYFRKPVMVNRYPVYVSDIAPKGFSFVEMDGEVTEGTVSAVRRVLRDHALRTAMVDRNYELARQHYSYGVLQRSLRSGLERAKTCQQKPGQVL